MTDNLNAFLHKVDAKVDKISDDLIEIKITMARNTDSLTEHMRRTSLLETIVSQNKAGTDGVKVNVDKAFAVVHFSKWLIGSSVVVGVVVAVVKWLI